MLYDLIDPEHYTHHIYDILVSPDSRYLLARSHGERCCLWNTETGSCQAIFTSTAPLLFSKNSLKILSYGPTGFACIWSEETGLEISAPPNFEATDVDLSFISDYQGWIYGLVSPRGPFKRFCWLPPRHRHIRFHSSMVISVEDSGVITRFDLADLRQALSMDVFPQL